MTKTISALVLLGLAGAAQATLTLVPLGSGGSSPSRITSLGLTAFPNDGLGGYSPVTNLPTPIGGSLSFSPTVAAADIGAGWATWSGGYTGDVYYSNGATSVDIGLPAGTGGFAFYAEPNPFAVWTITAKDNEGHSVSQDIDGAGGAAGWYAYTDGGSSLTSINVSSGTDFAVGEFGISAIPAPASLSLLGLGALAAGRRRR